MNTIIIGAGFAGLSAAHRLKNNYIILEKAERAGGFARTEIVKGFTIDYTGHLLHFRNEKAKDFILKNTKTKLNILKRNSFIYSCNVWTNYPYQTNMCGLPYNIIEENLIGFLNAKKQKISKDNFKKWVLTTFGYGIAKNFMLPYNKKLWKFPLEKLTINWLGRFVPVPSIDEIFRGITPSRVDTGYNLVFYYPEKGGIEAVIKNIYSPIKDNVFLKSEVKFIDLKKKILFFNDKKINYKYLISTMELPQLIKITGDKKLMQLASRLKAVSVYSLNVGFKNNNKNEKQWVYFPEKKYAFYRIGFFNNFSKYNSPDGYSSVFIEVSYKNKIPYSSNYKIIKDLIEIGIIKSIKDIKLIYPMILKNAYVIFDKEREKVLPEIKNILEKNDVFLAGRWGKWEYSSMEDAILDGFDVADKILAKG